MPSARRRRNDQPHRLRVARNGALVAALTVMLVIGAGWGGSGSVGRAGPSDSAVQERPAHGCAPEPGFITLEGRKVLEIRKAPAALDLQEYVRSGSARLAVLAEDRSFDPNRLEIRELPPYSVIGLPLKDSFLAETAVDDREAACFGITRQELASRYLRAIRKAVVEYRQTHTLGSWLRGTALALLVLGLYALVLRGEGTLNRRLREGIDTRPDLRIPRLGPLRLNKVLEPSQVRSALQILRRAIHWTLILLVSYLLIPLLLGFFPPTQYIAINLRQQILDVVLGFFNGVVGAIPNLLSIAVILGLTIVVIRASNAWFRALHRGAVRIPGFYQEWALPTSRLVAILLSLAGLVSAFPYIPGSGSRVFQGASLFVGVLAALGSSAVATNVISGLMLIYTRAFREGDRVQIEGTVGVVQDRTLLVTRIQTPRNELVSIPNSTVIGSSVVNYSFSRREILQPVALATTITIGYDVPWRQVEALMLAAARSVPGITDEIPAFVLQTSLNDFHISYELNAFVRDASTYRATLSELHGAIQDQFAAANVEILSPGYHAIRNGNASTVPGRENSAEGRESS
ncbi:MAG: mechanosensitive ion channel domain-containing protein [Synechococcaceae cyanobacterium]|nr:mechanosensitive ion channel domain-containing protein [Synechococcaceae cyanobacterium]